jgi:aspartyl-tRNA(Asn)/glutamyl-tRNA(Gln) amidotransferase subunit A
MSGDLPLTIKEAATALREGSLTAVELTTSMLDRIEAHNEALGAFVAITGDTALAAAAAADADLAAGVDKGPLQGIPLAIKDIIATKDAPTTANSRVLDPAWGSCIDAPVTARLRGAGAVLVGKATTMEFACGFPDPDKGFLVPHNPWNVEHTPMGSSSGTGVAVVAGMVLGGLGTDTGGSVRGPASANGHTGLKVTFGRVPKNGVVPLGYSLDSVGPMARSAYDCAALLQVMAGYDAGDPCAAQADVPDYLALLTGSVEGLKIGVPTPYFYDAPGLDPEVRDGALVAVEILRGLGAVVTEVVVPYAKEAKEANSITMNAEAFAYHRNNLMNRWDDYGCFTRTTIARAALLTSADFTQAQRFRSYFRHEVSKVLAGVDVLMTPTAAVPAPRADEMNAERMLTMPSYTGQWNFTGLPAVALPCGFASTGLPLSVQVIGSPFAEGTVLAVADTYQRVTDWHLKAPQLSSLAPAV